MPSRCVPGKHSGPDCLVDPLFSVQNSFIPPGWRAVPVSEYTFVYDPMSSFHVLCCPFHYVKGEPLLN